MRGEIYVSLVGPFLNKYARVPDARTDSEARLMCATDRRMQSLWCATYTKEQVDECIRKYGGEIIELYADGFEYDVEALRRLRAEIDYAND
jgi:hypothetical protein